MKFVKIVAGIAFLSFLAAPVMAQKYKVIKVSNGGSISGVIKIKGKVPKDKIKTVIKNKSQCGATITAEKYVISAAGGVKWAVAMLDRIAEGKALNKKANLVMDNKACRFTPHVMVAPQGGRMKIRNSDPMLHNSHFYLIKAGKKKNVINLALPKKGQEIVKTKILRRPGLLSVECDAHEFMQGYVWSLAHPYGVVTDGKGKFKLTDVPAGTHTLKVWHEAFGEKKLSVTVKGGQNTKVNVVLN